MYTLVSKVIPHAWLRMQIMSHLPRDHQFWYLIQYVIRCSAPLYALFQASNDWLPARNFHDTSLLCSWYFLKFQFESHFPPPSRCYRPDSQPCIGLFSWNTHLLFFRKYDGVPEERMPTWSWWPEAEKWRHQRNGSISSRRATKNTRRNFVSWSLPLYSAS